MKQTFKMVKVGQKVYSLTYGTGRVSRNSGDDFSVFFNNKKKDERIIVAYSYDGKQQYLNYPSKRDLYFKKPVIITKNRLLKSVASGKDEGFKVGVFMAKHMNNWHTEALKPAYNVPVLVFIPEEDNHITSGMWDISNKWVLLDENRIPECKVTHWLQMPIKPIQ